MKISLYRALKSIFCSGLFVLALSFEKAAYERSLILIGLFVIFLVWNVVRSSFLKEHWAYYIVDALIIVSLEYFSRYLVNYFFHGLYIVTVIEYYLQRNTKVFAPIVVSNISMLKFLYGVIILYNARTLAELVFNAMLWSVVVILPRYAIMQNLGKEKNAKLYKELLVAQQRLEKLSIANAELAVERERNRIAGDVHDSVGHKLTGLIMQLELLRVEQGDSDRIKNSLEDAREALKLTRTAVFELGDKGSSIEDLINDWTARTGVEVHGEVFEADLEKDELKELYNVIKEALTNSIRHGKASNVFILHNPTDRSIIYYDDGLGGEGSNGFGQNNMRSRLSLVGATLKVVKGKPYRLEIELRRETNDKSDAG